MKDIIQALTWRYAVKKFDDHFSLEVSQIDVLKNAFNLTATSFGLQPVSLVVLRDKTLRSQLVSHSYNQSQVAQASHLLVFCVHDSFDTSYIQNYFDLVKEVRNTPDEILEGYKSYLMDWVTTTPDSEKHQWAVKQAYLTMGNLLTVCAAEGIDACPMEGFDNEAYDKKLNLKAKNLKSVLIMPIGKRAEDDFFADLKKVRKPLEKVIFDLN